MSEPAPSPAPARTALQLRCVLEGLRSACFDEGKMLGKEFRAAEANLKEQIREAERREAMAQGVGIECCKCRCKPQKEDALNFEWLCLGCLSKLMPEVKEAMDEGSGLLFKPRAEEDGPDDSKGLHRPSELQMMHYVATEICAQMEPLLKMTEFNNRERSAARDAVSKAAYLCYMWSRGLTAKRGREMAVFNPEDPKALMLDPNFANKPFFRYYLDIWKQLWTHQPAEIPSDLYDRKKKERPHGQGLKGAERRKAKQLESKVKLSEQEAEKKRSEKKARRLERMKQRGFNEKAAEEEGKKQAERKEQDEEERRRTLRTLLALADECREDLLTAKEYHREKDVEAAERALKAAEEELQKLGMRRLEPVSV